MLWPSAFTGAAPMPQVCRGLTPQTRVFTRRAQSQIPRLSRSSNGWTVFSHTLRMLPASRTASKTPLCAPTARLRVASSWRCLQARIQAPRRSRRSWTLRKRSCATLPVAMRSSS
eukprot:Amastigsp_a513985_7.p6 type:complete len:115 gc:universal Amastigsp_a513985_7:134-478(+)